MKKIILFVAMLILFGTQAFAYNPLETTRQARQRHSAQRYERQQQYGTPLGGYSEKLGDVAPYGTERPGYTNTKGSRYNSNKGYYR